MDQTPPPIVPPDRKRERGLVLVMVLLMMSMLAMLASGAALRTSMDLREGGAQRIARSAYHLSETGTLATVALAAQMQGGFEEYVAAKSNKTLTVADMGGDLIDLTTTTSSFGKELLAVGGADFNTVVSDPELSSAVPGYDAARYCFRSFGMTTTAKLGKATPATVQELLLAGQAAINAHMTVGPVPCGQ